VCCVVNNSRSLCVMFVSAVISAAIPALTIQHLIIVLVSGYNKRVNIVRMTSITLCWG
jgi:hypothetical protein